MTTCPDDGTTLVLEAGGGSEGRPLRLGHVLGNYRLLRSLGEGGVGTVYAAEHVRLGRKVAIKLLHGDVVNDEVVTRFFNEARAVNEIRHPNIIDVEDFVTTPSGEHYMLMELLSGRDLRTILSAEGKLSPERVSAFTDQIASALAAVHRVGIIHRDLKPDNLFVIERDGKEMIKLLDFGIAKFTDEQQGVTRAGYTMGTPEYMAPEQITRGEAGPRTDLYSLGVLMYEALTGHPPFTGPMTSEVIRGHCQERVVPVSEARGEKIPAVLESVVMKLLAKLPEDRFVDADEVRDALVAHKPVKVSKQSQRMQTRMSSRHDAVIPQRSRLVWLVPLALVAAATAGAVGYMKRGASDLGPQASDVRPQTPKPAPAPPPPPAPAPEPPPPPQDIELALSSQPLGAEIFLGKDRRPLGIAPITAPIPISTEPVAIIARFEDGTEVTETIVPDRALPELRFVEPKPKVAARPRPKPAKPAPQPAAQDPDGTIDPFKQ